MAVTPHNSAHPHHLLQTLTYSSPLPSMFEGGAAAAAAVASSPSIWAAMSGWFTPTVLFLFLNLVIGTIAVTSKSSSSLHPKKHDDGLHNHHHLPRPLARGPSVLERLRSINLNPYRFRSDDIPFETVVTAPAPVTAVERRTVVGDVDEEEEEEEPEALPESPVVEQEPSFETLEEAFLAASGGGARDGHFVRSHSDSNPTAGEMPERLAGRMKKSASAKSAFGHFEPTEVAVSPEPRRPTTVRERNHREEEHEEMEAAPTEVDARADDFINRFRKQLQLQRLESIMRYKEMLNRGK